MKRSIIRSSIYNIFFYGVTAILAVLYIPALLLPRAIFIALVRLWLLILDMGERVILGLRYEVRGLENLPQTGSYIIAAKHQSEYETFKLRLIFNDPAIVLKRELLNIPLWGWYLKKSGVIAIDRSTPERALRSLQKGALAMKAAGRPIVIFPQGTRVAPGKKAPYKSGIARVQEVTGLPIIPLALNSGSYWPKNTWFKSPGTVVFEIMKPIPPGPPDIERQALMKKLEHDIETASAELLPGVRKLRHTRASRLRPIFIVVFLAMTGLAGYTAWWGMAEKAIRREYARLHESPLMGDMPAAALTISGFPGPMHIESAGETINNPGQGNIILRGITLTGWPFPGADWSLQVNDITIQSYRWFSPLTFEKLNGHGDYWGGLITIKSSSIQRAEFTLMASGTVDTRQAPVPAVGLNLVLENQSDLLDSLVSAGAIDERTATFMKAGFLALADEKGRVSVPLTQQGQRLYVGPFAVADIPAGGQYSDPTIPPPDAALTPPQ